MASSINKPFPDEHENVKCWECDSYFTTGKKCCRVVNKTRRQKAERRWRAEAELDLSE